VSSADEDDRNQRSPIDDGYVENLDALTRTSTTSRLSPRLLSWTSTPTRRQLQRIARADVGLTYDELTKHNRDGP
jgi:hypothetical protein